MITGIDPKEIVEKEFIKEGELKVKKIEPNSMELKESIGFFILFDDCLLMCSGEKDAKGKYEVKRNLSLEGLELASDITAMKRFVLFTLSKDKTQYEVLGKNQMDFRGWSLTIRNTVKAFKTTAPTNASNTNAVQMEMVYDAIKEGVLDNTISRAKKRDIPTTSEIFQATN
eukprot:TRINITY_DN6684_c0_g1_i3.p1 TRINITY_DN6684_c0_g1~~TRINITY_DN6684_c0_g1_i3.p1  ORF type:complete len:171 (-),score=53.81 TRINITY_DN6684_c0_g1_i3:88-600(-)